MLFIGGCILFEVGPIACDRWTSPGTVPEITSYLLPPWSKMLGIDYITLNSQNPSQNLTRRNGNRAETPYSTCYEIPRWQTVENDWTNITRPSSMTSDYVNSPRDPWTFFLPDPICVRQNPLGQKQTVIRFSSAVPDVFFGWILTV